MWFHFPGRMLPCLRIAVSYQGPGRAKVRRNCPAIPAFAAVAECFAEQEKTIHQMLHGLHVALLPCAAAQSMLQPVLFGNVDVVTGIEAEIYSFTKTALLDQKAKGRRAVALRPLLIP